MCLVAIAIDQSRRYPLVVASNRDEYFKRTTARLAWWSPRASGPAILGGRDLESGGTWLGLTAAGRLALVTNVRGMRTPDPQAPSRGHIVTDWLAAAESDAGDFWMRTAITGYNGFNLVAADFRRGECFWASNLADHPKRLDRGMYGLSNGLLDAPWPKVETLKGELSRVLSATLEVDELASRLFAALGDRTIAPDDALPHTGVPLEWERQLSPAFIRTPDQTYGTRCSTLVITERVGRQPVTHVFERTFSAGAGVALLRRATLRNWPPRYASTQHAGVAEARAAAARPSAESESPVSDVELAGVGSPGDGRATASGPRRTRVRSLLKPVAGSRRR